MTTSQDHDNHRVETRLELQETIFIETIASDSSHAGSVMMCNSLALSANGLQVVVDDDISIGSIFRLCIDLRDADPIFLVAEVKWKRTDPESDGFRIGFLMFESEDTDIQRWKELVADMLGS
ncbi:MAG TPA: hypothetical protein DCM54_12215 [Gammaproteobacteria bacterium]|nr:hypothetical protein [Gammaproteobacteria bacterium]|tara:strand:- start:1010 stop:1375 length:366 start_codon:yes stop_codon:yes gene_type:complete